MLLTDVADDDSLTHFTHTQHFGPANLRLRIHLGVLVPTSGM
jgi:hypothetical protein